MDVKYFWFEYFSSLNICGSGLGPYIKPHAMMSMWDEETPTTALGITCISVLPLPS
jgi:hypothetical protein